MRKIPFKVSARTARLIGRENVSNAEGALIELIKNGYDADATQVAVIFVDNKDLYIIDNGHGMTEEVINSSWMTIGTDNKEINPYTPKGRVKAGAKGIGRFALDRLGKTVEMFTLPEKGKGGYSWAIDWSEFEKDNTTVNDVEANLENIENLNLEQKIPQILLDSKEIKYKFSSGGTVLKISSLSDFWTKSSLQNLFKSMESLVPALKDDSFSLILLATEYKDDFGLVSPLINDDFDYRMFATFDSKNKTITVEIERRELDVLALEKKYFEVFSYPLMNQFPFDLETFKKGKFKQIYKIDEIMKGFHDKDNLFEKIGDFTFNLSYAKNAPPGKEDALRYPYKNVDYLSRREWLKQFGGIKVFRDNFRVRPYGELGEDWLKLGERAAQSPGGPGQRMGGFRVGPNQLFGSVSISRISNINFQDKSSREGIQENEAFIIFKKFIINIISIVERDRNTCFYSLSELYKKTSKKEEVKTEAKEAAKRIADKIKNDAGTSPFFEDPELKEDASKVAKALDVLEGELKDIHEENKILRSLASAGLVTAAVTHELRAIENTLLTRNDDLTNLIKPFIAESDLKNTAEEDNPYILLKEMKKTDRDLHEWINYSLTPLKKDKRLRKLVMLKNYFEDLYDMWKYILNERKIVFSTDTIDDTYATKAFVIDLDTIFNNLIINSIESFSDKKDTEKRQIKTSCTTKDNFYRILYSDNGNGLASIYRKNPSDIFIGQETSKKNGTGMGMYLVKSVLDDYNGQVEVLLPDKGFAIALFFPINSK